MLPKHHEWEIQQVNVGGRALNTSMLKTKVCDFQ